MNKDIVVRAGAGAGKTTWLTQQVIDLAKQGQATAGEFPKMVVTTFTRKATQELRERLIFEACKSDDPELIQFVSSPSQLFITTIHGVFSQFLRKYGHLVDFDSEFEILSSSGADHIFKRVMKEFSQENEQAQKFVQQLGYSRSIGILKQFNKVWMKSNEIKPITSSDLELVLRESLFEYSRGLGFLASVIEGQTDDQKWCDYGGRLKNLGMVLGEEKVIESFQRGRNLLGDLGRKPTVKKSDPQVDAEFDDQLKIFLKDLKEFFTSESSNPDHWPNYIEAFETFQGFASDYCAAVLDEKQMTGQFELEDLELMAARSVEKQPELALAFGSEWDHWLIDEYQDTSPLQVDTLAKLTEGKPVYTVGDPQQSIYLFRGANLNVFSQREEQVKTTGGEVQFLKKNYRSRPELLEFFNHFFSKLGSQFSAMVPREEVVDPEAIVCRLASVEPGDNQAQEEMASIADHVNRLVKEGVSFDEICILGRTNKKLEVISRFLENLNIPTHIHAASGFYSRQEIVDAFFVIKFLVNPHDSLSLIGLFRSPWFYVPDTVLSQWTLAKGNEDSLWTYLVQESLVPENLRDLLQCRDDKGVVETFYQFVRTSSYVLSSKIYDPTGRRESNIWKLVEKIREEEGLPGFNIIEFVRRSELSRSKEMDSDESDAVAAIEPNRVNLMTVHGSKGLKFNHIVVPHLHSRPNLAKAREFTYAESSNHWSFQIPIGEEGKFVSNLFDKRQLQLQRERELEEGDRILYVALTRAAKSAFLCFVDKPEGQSWLQRLDIDFSRGVHKTKKFSFEVSSGPWECEPVQVAGQDQTVDAIKPMEPSLETSRWDTYSVSSLLEQSGESTDFAKTGPSDVEAAMLRTAEGTVIHKFMETLHTDLDFDFSQVVGVWFGDRSESVLSAIEYVKGLQQPPMVELLKNGHAEWGFQFLTDQGIMEGQIDLWGKDQNGDVWVVDYKSGSERYADKAFEQLKIYAKAIGELESESNIKLAVIYPLTKKCFVKEV